MNNDIENQINDLTSTSPAETQQVAQEDLSSKPDKNATTHMYGIGLEGQDAPILQEEASAEGRGIDMSQEANGLVVGTAIPNNTYNTSYVSADKGSELLFNPNVYDPMPYPMLQPREKEAIAAMKQAYIMVEGNRVPEDYIGYTPLPREGSLSMWSHTVGNVQNTTMNLIPMTIKSGTGVANAITYGLGEAIKYPLNLLNKSAYANTAFGRWANNLSNYIDISGIQASSDRLADAVDKTLDPVEQLAAKTYDADLSDNSIKANIGRGFGSGLVMLGLGIGMNSPTLAASIFNLSELNAMKNRALDAGVSPAWAHAYGVGGAAAMTALDVVEIMGGMGTLTLTYKAGRDYLKHLGKRGTLHYLGKEAGEMGAEAGVEMVQETIEGWYDPEFRENPVDRLFVAGVSAVALRGLGVVPSIRHAKLADQAEMAAYYGVTKEYNDLLKTAKSVVDDMVAKGVIDPSQYNEVLHSMISEAPDTLVETLRLGVKGSIDAIPEEERRNFAQTLKAIQSSFGKDVFSPETMQALDTETEKKLAGIRNGLSNAEVDMIKGIVRGTYVMSAIANANSQKYKFNIPDFVVSTDPDGASYFTKDGKTIGIHESRSNTENTNISPDFAGMVRSNFIRSTAMSDKMASILHEMSHWIDYSVGKKGFTDFLEHYYNNIAKVFGNDKAAAVYNKSKKGKKRWTDEPVSYTDESRASEYFAQAVARLGKRSAEAFGLGKSEANEFLSYANIMLNQLANLKGKNGEALITSISGFQSALQNATRTNMGKLANLIDVYGSDNIKRALKNFNSSDDGSADFAEYLASKDMLSELFDVMNGFADASGAQKIDELFDNDQDAKANFVTMGDQLFREGYDTAVDEVRQRRKEAKAGDKAKPKQAKADPDAIATLKGILISDTTDSSQVHEDGAQYEKVKTWHGTKIQGDFGQVLETVTPDTDTMLNENKPHSEQTEFVKKALSELRKEFEPIERAYNNGNDYDRDMNYFDNSDGRDLYLVLERVLGSKEAASRLLNKYGITGIEYNGQNDGRSFVIFDPQTIDIVDKVRGRSDIADLEQGDIEYEAQDWAKAAMAKDSVEESFKAGEEPKKPISADIKIDGRDLGDDITMAQSGLRNRLANPLNKVTKWAASSPWGWGLDRILVTILGRNTAEKFDVSGKYGLKQEKRSGYWDEFMTRLKPLFGNPKTKTELMFKYKTMTTDLGFVRMKGLEIIDPLDPELSSTKDITGWEAMYVYLMKEQGFGDRIQKSTTTNINDIIATLSEEEKAFALEMSNQLMSMYEKTFGKSKYEHYFPILSAEHELFDELSIDSLTARMNTDDAIAIYDAGRIFSQYISRWASHESGYFETMRRVRDTFRYAGVDQKQTGPKYAFDPSVDEARIKASAMVANSTRQVIGEDGYRNLINLITSELQDSQERMFDASRNHALTQMGNNIVKSILSNKIISFPKNVSNLFMMWGGAKDQGVYWNNFAEGWGNAKSTYEYMMKNSSEIRQRWNSSGGINEYLDQKTLGGNTAPAMKALAKVFAKMNWTNDKTQNMAKFSAAMDMLGDAGLKAFMQSGDMIANVYGGYGLVKDYMAQGMSEAEAFKKLDRYIVEHQSSSNLAMKPLIQKKANNSILGQVFAFTSEGVAKWASILGTFDEVKMGTARKSEAIANLVSIAISMALYSALAAGVWDLFDDDEKVREDAQKALVNTAIDQVFSGFVAGNAMITPAISYLVGDSRISGMSVPIYNFAIDGITSLKKGEYDKVVVKAMSAAGLPVGADNLWNTLLGASMLNDKDPDIRYAGKLMTLGYTQNRASKRADVKKEKLENNSEE